MSDSTAPVDGRHGGWFQTYTGKLFFPGDPRVEEICIEDIAHALSMVCRFAGHCREFYSVAQHSVLVSLTVPPSLALDGLLHDASEAYIHDITRPMKRLPGMAYYRELEHRTEMLIAERFGLTMPQPPEIKDADNRVLMTERRDLLTIHRDWTWRAEPLPERIAAWSPEMAEVAFLTRFEALTLPRKRSCAIPAAP